jgi:uncharacterized protein
MLYRKLGKTGIDVSALGFGCMRLPLVGGIKKSTDVFDPSFPIDEELATKMIDTAVGAGVNYFDTAYPYHGGLSEKYLGRALKPHRDKIMLATKFPTWLAQSEADFDRLMKEQLERLQTSYFDFYLVHGLNRQMWDKMKEFKVFKFLERIQEDGRARFVGFSFHDEKTLFKEIVDAYDWAMCLIQYNYYDENDQAGRAGLVYAAAKGLGVVVMEPLRGGKLAVGVPDQVMKIWELSKIKRTPAEWALRWVWDHPQVSSALSGMNSMSQLEENLKIVNEALPDTLTHGEYELILQVKDTYKKLLKVDCTTCAYCLPCPVGVNIPMNLTLYNDTFLFGDAETSYMIYNNMMAPEVKASNCSECGQCEERCPQNIKIIEELKNVHKRLSR